MSSDCQSPRAECRTDSLRAPKATVRFIGLTAPSSYGRSPAAQRKTFS
jgi:hypothetical protein